MPTRVAPTDRAATPVVTAPRGASQRLQRGDGHDHRRAGRSGPPEAARRERELRHAHHAAASVSPGFEAVVQLASASSEPSVPTPWGV